MADVKPLVVIVPGGWHQESAYSLIHTALTQANFDVSVVSLPSLASKAPSTADCKTDADAVHKKLVSLVEEGGHDVVVLAHSYGGIPAGGAACGLSKMTRAKEGKKGGIVGLVYMSGFVVPEGQSLVEFLGGQHAPYVKKDEPSEGLCKIWPPEAVLYNDVPTELSTKLSSMLQPHATLAFESPAPPQAWAEPDFEGRLAFLRCSLDEALPPVLQDMFVEKSGVKWAVKNVESGHSPWASKPVEVVQALEEFLKGFVA